MSYPNGVVAQSVEPWTWPKNRGWVVRGFESHRLYKKVPFFMGISSYHANGSTVSFSYPIQYFGSGSVGMWENRVYGKTLVRELGLV